VTSLAATEKPAPPELRAGMVALVGRANTGKSSLLNALLGEKVSIVSPVAQTTRNLIRGMLNEPRGQMVFLDTPGMHQAPSDLGRIMNRVARAAVEGVDAVLLVLDSSQPPRVEDDGWMRRLLRRAEGDAATRFFLLNKRDLGARHAADYRALCDQLTADLAAQGLAGEAPRWREISAQTGAGLADLLTELFDRMPCQPPLFPADVLSDFPRKLAIGDFIREKLIGRLRAEMPHRVAVEVDDVRDEPDGGWFVTGAIYVEQPSQKGIVIGHKGRTLRAIRRASEKELSAMYERPVRVDLMVRIEKNWSRNFWFLKRLGYV